MSKQARPNWLQARPRSNDLKEIWIGGYAMSLITTFDPDMDVTDDSVGVFGYSGTIDTKIINAGTISMAGIFDNTMQVLFDVATNIDPATTGIRGNRPQSVYLDIVRLTKEPNAQYYEYVELFPKVNFVVTPSGGGPKDKPTFTFNGRCDVPIGFRAESGKGIAITTDVIALASDGTGLTGEFTDFSPTQVPTIPGYENSGKYALLLEIQRRATDATASPQTIDHWAYIPVTDTNVVSGASKGQVVITANDLLGTGLAVDDVSSNQLYAFVTFLVGVETLTAGTSYLLGSTEIPSRGKFDLPGT